MAHWEAVRRGESVEVAVLRVLGEDVDKKETLGLLDCVGEADPVAFVTVPLGVGVPVEEAVTPPFKLNVATLEAEGEGVYVEDGVRDTLPGPERVALALGGDDLETLGEEEKEGLTDEDGEGV